MTEDEAWRDALQARFPRWGTPDAAAGWTEVRARLTVGDLVHGSVIAGAPFGVWLDIGVGFPALLLVTEMRGLKRGPVGIDDFPAVGADVEVRIGRLGPNGEIATTQKRAEDDPWRDAARFAVGTIFSTEVVWVAAYGVFVELVPGVDALLRPGGELRLGDRVTVEVLSVDPVVRKVEVSLRQG